MQPIFILHKYMISDVMSCGILSRLCFYMDLTYHALFWLCKGLPAMCEGLPAMCEVCLLCVKVCLSCATTAIVIHV